MTVFFLYKIEQLLEFQPHWVNLQCTTIKTAAAETTHTQRGDWITVCSF